MNWTKIPTNLLISRTPDNELVAIVKYQLLWADLEYQPTDEIALRYMSNKQLASVKQYLNDIEAQVVSDIKSTVNHRGGQKTYYKKKQSLKQNTDGQCDNQYDSQCENHTDGADKIRLDKIRKEKEISNDISKKKTIDFDTVFQAGGQLWELPPQFRKLALTKYTEEEIRKFEIDHSCHENPVDVCLNDIKHEPKTKRFVKPTVEEIAAYCKERGNSVSPDDFFNFYESKGWLIGKSPMKDWKAAVRTWEKNNFNRPQQPQKKNWSNYVGEGSFLRDAKDDPFMSEIYNKKD